MHKIFVLPLIVIFGMNQSHAQNIYSVVISESIEILEISPNTYIHQSYVDMDKWGRVGANGLVLRTADGVVIIDTPWNNEQAEQLINWIEQNWKEKIAAIVVTHFHNDNAGGLEAFHKAEIPSFGLEMTQQILEDQKLAAPVETFTDSLILNIGKYNIELYYPGGGHSKDNIVVWIQENKVLFGGCIVKAQKQNNLGNTKDADLKAWPNSLKKLELKYSDANYVIPGHGPAGGPELITHTINLFSE